MVQGIPRVFCFGPSGGCKHPGPITAPSSYLIQLQRRPLHATPVSFTRFFFFFSQRVLSGFDISLCVLMGHGIYFISYCRRFALQLVVYKPPGSSCVMHINLHSVTFNRLCCRQVQEIVAKFYSLCCFGGVAPVSGKSGWRTWTGRRLRWCRTPSASEKMSYRFATSWKVGA